MIYLHSAVPTPQPANDARTQSGQSLPVPMEENPRDSTSQRPESQTVPPWPPWGTHGPQSLGALEWGRASPLINIHVDSATAQVKAPSRTPPSCVREVWSQAPPPRTCQSG